MIQPSAPYWQSDPWKKSLAEAVKDPQELFQILSLPASYLPAAQQVAKSFPLRVTHSYLARMQPGNIYDPLLLQVLPLHAEALLTPGYHTDPVGDLAASKLPGVIHKYHGRVLLVTTGACAVHCRYCFRRHFPYGQANPAADNWQAGLDYIAADSSIHEVILSGGDPLSLSDQKLVELARKIEKIAHVNTLRIHTRLPVVLPQRIYVDFVARLTATRLNTVMVIHSNHANEINDEVTTALHILRNHGVVLLNQSVLLKNINDNAEDLAFLSKKLFAAGVMPYYLHVLDAVQGAAHFAVTAEQIRTISSDLCKQLPGYLVPKLVKETAGAEYKLPVIG